MKIAIGLVGLMLAACSGQQALMDVESFGQMREAGAQGDATAADDADSEADTAIPENTPVVGMRQMHVKVTWDEEVDWDKAKGTILYYTWDKGKTWTRSEKALERRVLGGNETHVFTITVDRDGLLGFYFINPADGNVSPPDEETKPKRYVLVDTAKPKAQSIFIVRTSNTSVKVAWSFTDEALSDTGVSISINGKEVATGQPSVGETDVGVQGGKVTASVTCTDRAGNRSEASTAMLP